MTVGENNLCNDIYLRWHKDLHGCFLLSLVASFPRFYFNNDNKILSSIPLQFSEIFIFIQVQELTTDLEILQSSLLPSTVVEVMEYAAGC
uniref:Uncharacterized protein n=1 Tax=Oryza brachyantha TaxID=4533 RepID=J3N2W4_ORYBR